MDEERAKYLADQCADMLVRIGYTWFSNREDAQDLCRTVLLKLLENPRSFPDGGRERAWVIRVAVNLRKNWKKSAWFRRTAGPEEGRRLDGQTMEVTFGGLCHQTAWSEAEMAWEPVYDCEETWSFRTALTYPGRILRLEPNAAVATLGVEATITRVEISPIGVCVYIEGDALPCGEIFR